MKKNQLKALKNLSEQLPESKELQKYSIVLQGFEINSQEYDPKQHDIQPEEWYKQGGHFRLVEIDHFNRLKKAYARKKEQGLVDYINWVDQNNIKLNQLFEDMELQRVSEEIKAIADKGAKSFWSNLLNFLFAFLQIFKPQSKPKYEEINSSL
jgi:hypothetical protein